MLDKIKSKIKDFEEGKAVFCCLITAERNSNGDLDVHIQVRHNGIDVDIRQEIVAGALIVLAEQHGLTSLDDDDDEDEDVGDL